jgi:iron(III) transport system permease protein
VPTGSATHWRVTGTKQPFTGVSLAGAAGYTFLYSAAAAALATFMALPVAILAVRRGSRTGRILERSTYLVLAMPGLVIALSLAYFSETYADGLWYHTAPMLVAAYAIMFFPLALVGVRASVAQAPPELEDIARSLGQRRLAVLWRVTRPLVAPGLAAAFRLAAGRSPLASYHAAAPDPPWREAPSILRQLASTSSLTMAARQVAKLRGLCGRCPGWLVASHDVTGRSRS